MYGPQMSGPKKLIYADKRLGLSNSPRLLEHLKHIGRLSKILATMLLTFIDLVILTLKVKNCRSSEKVKEIHSIQRGSLVRGIDVFLSLKRKTLSLKFILALLKLKSVLSLAISPWEKKRGNLRAYQTPLSQIPIPKIPEQQQLMFIKVVDAILELVYSADYLHDKEKQKQVKNYESEIDQMTYRLFDFTTDQIAFIESNVDL